MAFDPWENFAAVARGERTERVPVALIVDSPWLAGRASDVTLDYYLFPELWLEANLALYRRWPEIVWVPGFWVEYGMTAEPSAFGSRMLWHREGTPGMLPLKQPYEAWAALEPADPQEHGTMPLALRMYELLGEQVRAAGHHIRMVAARGPMATASWLVGPSDLMLGLLLYPEVSEHLLDVVTETTIRWLQAQLALIDDPQGVLLLDDMIGMLSPATYERFGHPYLTRIWEAFPDLLHIYHNDTPCAQLSSRLAESGMDVWNFSHAMPLDETRAQVGPQVTLMGNVPPLDALARGTAEQVYEYALACVQAGAAGGPYILSAGGGVAPGTPDENVDALLQAARDHDGGAG